METQVVFSSSPHHYLLDYKYTKSPTGTHLKRSQRSAASFPFLHLVLCSRLLLLLPLPTP